MLAIIFAFSGLVSAELRFLNSILACWLFTASLFVPSLRDVTKWSNLFVSVGMFSASLLGRKSFDSRRGRPDVGRDLDHRQT